MLVPGQGLAAGGPLKGSRFSKRLKLLTLSTEVQDQVRAGAGDCTLASLRGYRTLCIDGVCNQHGGAWPYYCQTVGSNGLMQLGDPTSLVLGDPQPARYPTNMCRLTLL